MSDPQHERPDIAHRSPDNEGGESPDSVPAAAGGDDDGEPVQGEGAPDSY